MIRYGTIGTNFIVDRFQEAAMENPSLHYSAVYSRNQETAGNFAAKYGVETTYTDLNAFACADDLDAVYIASPNSFHYEQAALLLSHGKHVLCEKPVTSNARELEHLIQLAGQNNVILFGSHPQHLYTRLPGPGKTSSQTGNHPQGQLPFLPVFFAL